MSDLTAQQWNDRYPVGTVVQRTTALSEVSQGETTGAAEDHDIGVPAVYVLWSRNRCNIKTALSLLTPIEPEVRLDQLVLFVQDENAGTSIWFDAPPHTGRRLTGQAIIDAVAPLIERSKKS